MKLTANTVATITFTLRMGSYEGEIIEKVRDTDPLEFVFGTKTMLQSFEDRLEGLTQGASFAFVIPKEEAYGEYQSDLQVDFKKEFLMEQMGDPEIIEEELQLDNFIPMLDPDGNTLNGRITYLDEEKVRIDFNHPLADMDLYFTGSILKLRPASAAEIHDGKVLNSTKWEDANPDDPNPCTI
jgi:FKBP-type peptidyl-prolyl cis-trans isomerase SlyD